jgi:hypothetical protein
VSASNKIKNMGYQSSILAISLGLSLYNETEEEIKTNTQNKTKNIEMG